MLLEVVKEKLNPAPGYTALYREALIGLVANEDCLVLDLSERKRISSIAAKLKATQGMSFITRKAGEKVKVQKLKGPEDELMVAQTA